ncbi:hypothetical protein RUND412_000927 [Rhizina undulata]
MSPSSSLRTLASHVAAGNLIGDGDSGIRIAGFIPRSHSLRRPVTDYFPSASGYYNAFRDASTAEIHPNSPPTYDDAIQHVSLPFSRFKVLPREEEGREELPAYSCSLHREAVFYRKMELSSPFDRAGKRRWRKVYVVLHGTLLNIHKLRRMPFFGSAKRKQRERAGLPLEYLPGKLIKSYTLQLAEVGVAADYKKKHYVIRLRAQTEQFLLNCKELESFLDWLEAISAAVDLSPSLEERSLPRYQTIPRRRRRRRPEEILQQQEAIIRRDFPHLLQDSAERTATSEPQSLTTEECANLTPQQTRYSVQEVLSEQELRDIRSAILAPRQDRNANHPPPPSRSNNRRPNTTTATLDRCITEDGKWCPPPTITAEANLRYARRCMAVLCGDAPRQSDYVVVDGQRYKLLWEKKEMVLDKCCAAKLPSYEAVAASEVLA